MTIVKRKFIDTRHFNHNVTINEHMILHWQLTPDAFMIQDGSFVGHLKPTATVAEQYYTNNQG
jgi:hypothetical protein